MKPSVRKIIAINMLAEGPVQKLDLTFGAIPAQVTEHRIGWDFETASSLIRSHDGSVDGIALIGIRQAAVAGRARFILPAYRRLVRVATRTPVYVADDLFRLFSDWTFRRVLREQPQLFQQKKVLFHYGTLHPLLDRFGDAEVRGADALLLAGVPKLLRGREQLGLFIRAEKAAFRFKDLDGIEAAHRISDPRINRRLRSWIAESDVFVGSGAMLAHLAPYEELEGKIVVLDHCNEAQRNALRQANVSQLIELIPDKTELDHSVTRHFSVLSALLDQDRIACNGSETFEEHALQWIQQTDVQPRPPTTWKKTPRRCAFIVHPLSQRDLWKVPALGLFSGAPSWTRNALEAGVARLPGFHLGTLTGATSLHDGQEVACDIYALAATPRQLLAMDENDVQDKLIRICENAHQRGASLIGLPAQTKIVGDAGITVARRSPIPLTNGNSFSASTALWAARAMVERMALIPSNDGATRLRAKAMIIGATESVGRVSALLVSMVFEEVVLVAARPDKLLELQQEILELSPDTRVRVTTNASPELPDIDLVVAVTPNQPGTPILDMKRVKPGAVICDCSRPRGIDAESAAERPDVLVIESGEVLLPGLVEIDCDIGLPKPSVYSTLAETVVLTMEGRFESFSLSNQLSLERTKEIYKLALKHGARLSAIQGPRGLITDELIERTRELARERLQGWSATKPGLRYREAAHREAQGAPADVL